MKLDYVYFEKLLNFTFSDKVRDEINDYNIEISNLSEFEQSQITNKIKNVIDSTEEENSKVKKAGNHRLQEWNFGWNENSIEFEKTKNLDSLIPKYFGKYDIVRLDSEFKQVVSPNAELNMLRILQKYVYEKYIINSTSIYEFGCGTGHNLVELNKVSGIEKVFGFDWTSTPENIFKNLNLHYAKDFMFRTFDFTQPDYDVEILDNSSVCTFAALEQIGENNQKFIDFLVSKRPGICIHLEPIKELLDENEEFQKLSIDYITKRNYLSNFYNNLKNLEKLGVIEIIESKRTKIGSLFLEGYNLVVWKVK